MPRIHKLGKRLDQIEGGSTLIPAGTYAVEVNSIDEGKGPGGDPYIRVSYIVTGKSPFKGVKPFPDHISLSKSAEWKLGQWLRALGAPGHIDQVDWDKMVGKKMIVQTTHKLYNEIWRNKYDVYMPWSEELERSTSELPVPKKSPSSDGEASEASVEGAEVKPEDW